MLKSHDARRCGALAVSIVLCSSGPVLAQGFVGGAFVFSWQPEGPGGGGPLEPNNGIGGSGVGIGASVGWFFMPKIALEFEVTIPSRFEGLETTFRFQERDSVRDVIFSPMLRLRPVDRGPEFVAGVSWIVEQAERESSNIDFVTGAGPFHPLESSSEDKLGFVGGLDFPFRLSSRMFLTPQLRLHWIPRDRNPAARGVHGLSAVVWRPAVALIARF